MVVLEGRRAIKVDSHCVPSPDVVSVGGKGGGVGKVEPLCS